MELNKSVFEYLKEKGLTHSKTSALTMIYSALEQNIEFKQGKEIPIIANEFVKSNSFLPSGPTFRNYLYDLEELGLIVKREEKGKCVYVKPNYLEKHQEKIIQDLMFIYQIKENTMRDLLKTMMKENNGTFNADMIKSMCHAYYTYKKSPAQG